MNKAQLVEKMAASAGISKNAAERALNGFIEAVTEALQQGDKVTLIGFGTFSVVERKARQGRNPQTGEVIEIPAKKVVKFKPGSRLSEGID